MTKGRKSTPKALQQLRGNPRKLRINAPADPAFETAIPAVPEYLDGKALEEWYRITEELSAKQIITTVDKSILGVYCQAVGELHRHTEAKALEPDVIISTRGIPQMNPRIREIRNLRIEIAKYSSELGMTPTARNKVRMVGGNKSKPTKVQSIAENLFKVPVKK